MPRIASLIALIFLIHAPAISAVKPHSISFGKWTTVKWLAGHEEDKPLDLKVRPLYVDGRLKEYTIGMPHEITDHLFVVRRAFRLNDTLPEDKGPQLHWLWELGGWLLIDRVAAHISQINLPEFDSYYSVASWYRDYVAYCGVSGDGGKLYQIVAQLGRRRPVLRKVISQSFSEEMPDSACPVPTWQRQPVRVTFFTAAEEKSTYQVRGHAVDLVKDDEEEDTGSE